MSECGFKIHGICYSDDLECYGERCRHDNISSCPVHLDNSHIDLKVKSGEEELRLYRDKINLYKQELTSLRGLCDGQEKIIQQLTKCIIECDPWFCEQMKERLK
jgi:hypothetical protein